MSKDYNVEKAIKDSLKNPKLTKFAEGRSLMTKISKYQRVYLYMDDNNNIFIKES